MESTLNRRRFIKNSFSNFGAGVLASSLSSPLWAQSEKIAISSEFWIRPRKVKFRHPSGDTIEAVYWSDGELIRPAYDEISWFMRDRVVHQGVWMNPILLDISYGVCGWLDHFGLKKPLTLTSGHRNRIRNASIEGAAKDSLHITGNAIDIQISDISPLQVSKFGIWLGGGGVGWYPSKNFTHLDRGRLRSWKG